ncbi:hypothetical protein FOZ63_020430 [Perkinsus olseni]|uniref:Uncharacterized protein n=1 Tax=Perkinsus olseni TaxID=32597 RepID=A0A7J6P5R8_PEROL|nr:hypothetical protein FOZ63_020430 [Perkinsus olseni]
MGFCSIAGCFEFCRGRRAPLPSSASGTAASVVGGGAKQKQLSSRPCRMPQGDELTACLSTAPYNLVESAAPHSRARCWSTPDINKYRGDMMFVSVDDPILSRMIVSVCLQLGLGVLVCDPGDFEAVWKEVVEPCCPARAIFVVCTDRPGLCNVVKANSSLLSSRIVNVHLVGTVEKTSLDNEATRHFFRNKVTRWRVAPESHVGNHVNPLDASGSGCRNRWKSGEEFSYAPCAASDLACILFLDEDAFEMGINAGTDSDRIEMVHLIFDQMFRDSDAALDQQVLNFQRIVGTLPQHLARSDDQRVKDICKDDNPHEDALDVLTRLHDEDAKRHDAAIQN